MHKVVSVGVISGCMLTFMQVSTAKAQTTTNTEQEKITEQELEEVTVLGSRVELSLNQTARLVTVITRQEIEQAPVQSIQDLLNYAANVDVMQRGGHGVQADISIRGGSPDQTAILLNGINLSNSHTGHYSFDIPINLSDIDRIEIIQGPSSLIYGASAFSGGINIITKKKPDSKAYARIEAGGHKLFGAEARGALSNKTITSQLSAGYSTSDGYMKNSDYDIFNLLWQTGLNIENSKLDIQLGYNDKQYGANTFYSSKYPNQYDKTKTYLVSVSGNTGNTLKLIPKVYWTRHDDCFQLIRGDESKVPYNYHRNDVYGANLNIQYSSLLGITSFGSEFRNEGVKSTVLGKPMDEPDGKYKKSDNRTNVSFALEHNILFKRATVSLGLLANYNTTLKNDYKFYPAINMTYRLNENIKLYASWNKAMRMPTFTDLYYNTATHAGNAGLKPENSEAFEIGFRYYSPFIRFSITGYYMEGKNLIDWVWKQSPETDDGKWESQNLAKVYKNGFDTEVMLFPGELMPCINSRTTLKLGYVRLNQKGRNNSGEADSKYILNYIRDKFIAQLNMPLYKGVSVNSSFKWQNRMGSYIEYINYEPAEKKSYTPYSTLDVRINWETGNFLFNISVNNIYDAHYYDIGNIPQAGFWLSSGISYTFK